MERDFHMHRDDLSARGLAGYLACPTCSRREVIAVTETTARALEQLLKSIQEGGSNEGLRADKNIGVE